MFKKLISTSDDIALTILRLVLGVVFFAHGAQKVLGWFGGFGYHGTMAAMTHFGLPPALMVDFRIPDSHSGLRGSLPHDRRDFHGPLA